MTYMISPICDRSNPLRYWIDLVESVDDVYKADHFFRDKPAMYQALVRLDTFETGGQESFVTRPKFDGVYARFKRLQKLRRPK